MKSPWSETGQKHASLLMRPDTKVSDCRYCFICGVVLLLGNKEEKVSLLATFVVKYSNLVQGFGVFCLWKLFKNGKALLVFGIWKLMTNTNSAFTAGNNHICCRSCSYMLNLEGLI